MFQRTEGLTQRRGGAQRQRDVHSFLQQRAAQGQHSDGRVCRLVQAAERWWLVGWVGWWVGGWLRAQEREVESGQGHHPAMRIDCSHHLHCCQTNAHRDKHNQYTLITEVTLAT